MFMTIGVFALTVGSCDLFCQFTPRRAESTNQNASEPDGWALHKTGLSQYYGYAEAKQSPDMDSGNAGYFGVGSIYAQPERLGSLSRYGRENENSGI